MNNLLKDYTTLKIGGPAKEIIPVTSKEVLIETIKNLKNARQQFLVIGGGSNLLVSDEGTNKVIIKNELLGIEQIKNILKVKSGTPLQTLVNFSIDSGLAGLNKLSGIPGTVGGAIYGNAGAYGQSISDHLINVTTFDGEKVVTLSKEDCQFEYRYSIFKKNHFTVIEAEFDLIPANSEDLKTESAEIIQKRLVKYPEGIKCPGSFFKNIVASTLPQYILDKIPKEKIVYGKIPAGSLLEEVGAKGDSRGDIEIATYHANLFVNKNEGTSQDFHDLAKKYYEKVREKYGIKLEPEVQFINLPQFDN